jgi:hypothetical protein
MASPPFLAKYLRLRREWLCADPVSGRHRRLAHELAQLERDFVVMGVRPFVDTQPYNYWESQAAVKGDE